MRLIFLTSRLPYPPDRGDRLRTFHFLRQLSREHEITLVSFVSPEEIKNQKAHELAAYCQSIKQVPLPTWKAQANVLKGLWDPSPLQVLYYHSNEMRYEVNRLVQSQSFDAAYVHLFRMAPYLKPYPTLYRVLDLTDMISTEIAASLPFRSAASRTLYRVEQKRIERFEPLAASWYDEVWFISDRDRRAFSDKTEHDNVVVIPNGVDQQLFGLSRDQSRCDVVLFVGHLEVPHNIDAVHYLATEILPLVRQDVPGTKLFIAGSGRLDAVERLSVLNGVRILGFVPDLVEAYATGRVFAAPLRFSAGVQNKVLEAMAAGVPVVTGQAVVGGLNAAPDRDVLQADSAAEYARNIVRLLRDDELNQKIGGAGRDYVRRHFSWQTAASRLREIAELLQT